MKKDMNKASVGAEDKKQTIFRLPISLRTRINDLKFSLSDKRKKQVTNDEIAISALDAYLKKFGK